MKINGKTLSTEDIELLSLTEPEEIRTIPMAPPPDYTRMHDHLRYWGGPARNYSCVDCGGQAAHWSLEHEDRAVLDPNIGCHWSPHMEDYQPRCASCHQLHDLGLRVWRRTRA